MGWTIQRVREACANGYPDAQYPDFDGGYQTACEDILRALDGETPNKGDQ